MPLTGLGLPYPASTDSPRGWEQIQSLAAAADTLISGLITPVVTIVNTDVGTAATGFSTTDVRAATLLLGHVVDLDLYIGRTGTDITATAGNITDTLMFTLAAAWWPAHVKSCVWSNGTSSGEAVINTDGTINLRTASGTISGTAGGGLTTLRLSASYIK